MNNNTNLLVVIAILIAATALLTYTLNHKVFHYIACERNQYTPQVKQFVLPRSADWQYSYSNV